MDSWQSSSIFGQFFLRTPNGVKGKRAGNEALSVVCHRNSYDEHGGMGVSCDVLRATGCRLCAEKEGGGGGKSVGGTHGGLLGRGKKQSSGTINLYHGQFAEVAIKSRPHCGRRRGREVSRRKLEETARKEAQ